MLGSKLSPPLIIATKLKTQFGNDVNKLLFFENQEFFEKLNPDIINEIVTSAKLLENENNSDKVKAIITYLTSDKINQ